MTEPTPADSIPESIANQLDDLDEGTLRAIEDYTSKLADYRGQQDDEDADEDGEKEFERPDDVPDDLDLSRDDAPASATLTTKTIKDHDYYYWQWREGGTVRSEYIGPVSE